MSNCKVVEAFEFTLAEIPINDPAIVYIAKRYERERGSLPSAAEVRARFELVEGELRWKPEQPPDVFASEREFKRFTTRYAGTVAGAVLTAPGGCRYRYVGYRGRLFKAHQLIALMHLGFMPWSVRYHGRKLQIDHINHQGLDNRLGNLRLATNGVNHRNRSRNANNTTGIAGVGYNPRRPGKPWHAQLKVNGKYVLQKRFETLLDAAAAVVSARNRHDFHQNHGKP